MSAWAELVNSNGSDEHLELCSRALREVQDAHAHRLAEKIRNSEELRDLTDDHMSDCNAAADLIDPGGAPTQSEGSLDF